MPGPAGHYASRWSVLSMVDTKRHYPKISSVLIL